MTSEKVRVKSAEALKTLTNEYWADVKGAKKAGRPVAWSAAMGPVDILTSMDFAVVFPESYAAVCGAKKVSTEFCQKAESYGYSPDLCSYARNGLGAVLSGDTKLCPVGGLPKPDILVASSYCTAIIMWFEALSRFYDIPLVMIDLPFVHDPKNPDNNRRIVSYLKEQLQEEVAVLERVTKRRFDYDRLQERIETTAAMSKLWQGIIDTAKNVPSPVTVFDLFTQMFPITCFRGNPKGIAYYKLLKEELDEKVAQGIGAIPNEKYRLYWDNIAIWYNLRELSTEFASHNACLVTGIYPNTFVWHTDKAKTSDPLDYVATVIGLGTSHLNIESRASLVAQYVRDYSLDGLIMQASRTCKIMSQDQPAVVELVEKATGVPAVMLEADMCDPRQYSEAQTKMRIKAFMELLENRKKK